MRSLVLAALAAAVFSASPLLAATMPKDVGGGNVAWFDLTTTDLAKSKAFYGALLGWTYAPVEGTDGALEIVSGKRGIGTLRTVDGAIGAHNGVVYIQVTDLPGKMAKATELGGSVIPGFPFDLPGNVGAIGLVVDPAGHPLGLYSRTKLPKEKKD
jgi:predicted enzyme related to lactoylglutathione lyase